jgi:hypothetical protein
MAVVGVRIQFEILRPLVLGDNFSFMVWVDDLARDSTKGISGYEL